MAKARVHYRATGVWDAQDWRDFDKLTPEQRALVRAERFGNDPERGKGQVDPAMLGAARLHALRALVRRDAMTQADVPNEENDQ